LDAGSIKDVNMKLGRNDPCHCGSGKKYKLCCLLSEKTSAANIHSENTLISKAIPRVQFLLIRAWGAGFWSDMHHVLGQLVIAEVGGMVPIVNWGEESRYSIDPKSNAWDNFFEPLSEFSVRDMMKPRYSFYPPKWNHKNLRAKSINKCSGAFSRTSGVEFIGRREDVMVSDFFTYISDIQAGIKHSKHYLANLRPEEIYREIHERYIKLKPDIRRKIDEYAAQRFLKNPMIGVHYRNKSEGKLREAGGQGYYIESYFREIDALLAQMADAKIYLLTDTTEAVERFREKYGERIICREIDRVKQGDNTDIYYTAADFYQQAQDVIMDVYLAMKCDFFLGEGASNVSCAVSHLKNWDGKIKLFGQNILTSQSEKNFYDIFIPESYF
jgi:protein O-GlcNAc transferase